MTFSLLEERGAASGPEFCQQFCNKWDSHGDKQCAIPETRTKVLLISLGIGKEYSMLGLEWFKSAEKHFCNDYSRYEVEFSLMLDDSTQALLKQDIEAQYLIESFESRVTFVVVNTTFLLKNKSKIETHEFASHKYHFLEQAKHLIDFESFHFILMSDVDQEFVADCCEDLLGQRVALLHRSIWDKSRAVGPYSSGGASMLTRQEMQIHPYFSSQIYGGTPRNFIRLVKSLVATTDKDTAMGYVPVYHDESHLNWLWNQPDHMPTTSLSRAFKWPGFDENCSHLVGMRHVMDRGLAQRYCKEVDAYVRDKKTRKGKKVTMH